MTSLCGSTTQKKEKKAGAKASVVSEVSKGKIKQVDAAGQQAKKATVETYDVTKKAASIND